MSEYLTLGDTGSEGITWNSTKYPGTCKPSDFATLAKFKALQEQLNRVAQVKGFTKIAVDGDFGPGTVDLAKKVSQSNTLTCSALAGSVTTFTASFAALATSLSAPAKVAGPAPIKPPSIVNAAGNVVIAPPGSGNPIAASLYDSVSGLGTVGVVAAVGIAGGIGYLLFFKKKRRK